MALRSLLRIHTFPYCVLTLAYNVGRAPKKFEDIGLPTFLVEPKVAWISVDTCGAICVNLFLGSSFDACPYHTASLLKCYRKP